MSSVLPSDAAEETPGAALPATSAEETPGANLPATSVTDPRNFMEEVEFFQLIIVFVQTP